MTESRRAFGGREVIDEETLEELEETLLAADLGVATTMDLVDGIRDMVLKGQARDTVKLRELLVDQASILLLDAPRMQPLPAPRVTLVIGVNGVGKTTSIAKIARRSKDRGEQVLLAAGDTFRAAAIEQLCIWGERLDIEVIRQRTRSRSRCGRV